jgi:hypothetical protein
MSAPPTPAPTAPCARTGSARSPVFACQASLEPPVAARSTCVASVRARMAAHVSKVCPVLSASASLASLASIVTCASTTAHRRHAHPTAYASTAEMVSSCLIDYYS